MCTSKDKRATADIISEMMTLKKQSADIQRYDKLAKELKQRAKPLKENGDEFVYSSKLYPFDLESSFSKSGQKTECNFELLKALSSEIYDKVVTIKVTPPRHYLRAIDKATGKRLSY